MWLENDTLPAGQDIQVPRESLGAYAAQGWRESEDQSDRATAESGEAPALDEPAGADEAATDAAAGEELAQTDGEAAEAEPSTIKTTNRKG